MSWCDMLITSLNNDTVKELLPTSFTEMINNDKYQLILLNFF